MDTGPLPKRQVLLVDDVETIALLIKIFLNGLNLEFVTAPDGLAAWKKVQELKPALVIADVQMPNKDGLELCADIKSDPDLKHTPVVLFSVHARDEALQRRARLVGAYSILTKPVSPDELRRTVQEALGARAI